MNTLIAWLAFALMAWVLLAAQTHGKQLGKGRVPGPIWCAGWVYRRTREAVEEAMEATEDEDDGTDSDGHGPDTTPDTGHKRPTDADKPQDTTPDTTPDMALARPSDTAPQAADLQQPAASPAPGPMSTPDVRPATAAQSQSVIEPVAPHPAPVAPPEPPPPSRVIVHVVQPGDPLADTTLTATDPDGLPVEIRYRVGGGSTAHAVRPPAPDSDPDGDLAELDTDSAIDTRRAWLAVLDRDPRFSRPEVDAMYQRIWGRNPRTLRRDREAIAAASTTTS